MRNFTTSSNEVETFRYIEKYEIGSKLKTYIDFKIFFGQVIGRWQLTDVDDFTGSFRWRNKVFEFESTFKFFVGFGSILIGFGLDSIFTGF